MNRTLACLALAVVGTTAQAVSLYDSMTGVPLYVTTSANPGFLHADGANTIAPAGAGNQWEIDSIDWGMYFNGAQSYVAGELDCRIQIFATYNDNFNPVLSNPLATVDYTLGAHSSTGNFAFTNTGANLATPILLPVGATSFGWTESYFDNLTGGRIGTVRAAFSQSTPPTIGTSSQGFWRDANDNGVIEASEQGIFSPTDTADNMVIRFNGRPVPTPEPATMAALGLGVAVMIRRRRKK